ncbi:MAG: GWxTD domain-containing protein [Candidatus Aminicenantes bacterium]|nr:GWxTD domain-containing protein [Candidatus Aminicenantes bacterium]
MKASGRHLGVLVLAMAALAAACATSQAVKSLDDESRDFLSKVRYIITKQERERFLAIPAGDRKAFVDEFWEKRAPRPETGANEFKDQYFARIAEANHLFTEAAEPGWLQDRGRVYILLGPPTNRITYPRGITFYGVPTEIWYYGFFPIVFTDEWWNGNYKLDPVSVEQLSILNRAQMEWQPQIAAEKEQIDFSVKVKETKPGRALVEVAIPFRAIRFDVKDKTLRATFILTLDLMETDGKEIRQSRTEYPLEITEDKLRESQDKNHVIEVPVEAREGDYWLRLTLENANDGSKAYRRIKLSI